MAARSTERAPAPAPAPAAPRPTLDTVYLGLAVAAVTAAALSVPIVPHDFWFHLATGREIAAAGAVPSTDQFTFTAAGQPYLDQPWLWQLTFYGIVRLGGPSLAVAVHGLLLGASAALLLRVLWRRTGRSRLAAVVLLLFVLPLIATNFNVRPASHALPLFVGSLAVLERYRADPRTRWVWLLPLLAALWVNVHGSFVLAPLLVGGVIAGESAKRWSGRPGLDGAGIRRLLVVGAATTAALLLNPRGFGVVTYVTGLVGSDSVRSLVSEWQPPVPGTTAGTLYLLAVVSLLVVVALSPGEVDLSDLLIAVGLLLLAATAIRHLLWFGLGASPLLAGQLAARPARPARDQGRAGPNRALLLGLGLIVVLALPWVRTRVLPAPLDRLLEPRTPVLATRVYRADPDPPTRLFTSLAAGSYLDWAAPGRRVFVDPRIELFPARVHRDYLDASAAVRVDEVLDTYDLDGAMLDRASQEPLLRALAVRADWEVRYLDAHTAYLVRTGAS